MTSPLLTTLREVLMDAVHVSCDFFKVLIPISIAMKILAEHTRFGRGSSSIE